MIDYKLELWLGDFVFVVSLCKDFPFCFNCLKLFLGFLEPDELLEPKDANGDLLRVFLRGKRGTKPQRYIN